MTNQDGAKRNTPRLLRVLVYGTLKRGMWNHERFCAGALSIEEAVVCGRLYEMDCGLPVLKVPEADILAHGTADPCADVTVQARFEAEMAQTPRPARQRPHTARLGACSRGTHDVRRPRGTSSAPGPVGGLPPGRIGPLQSRPVADPGRLFRSSGVALRGKPYSPARLQAASARQLASLKAHSTRYRS